MRKSAAKSTITSLERVGCQLCFAFSLVCVVLSESYTAAPKWSVSGKGCNDNYDDWEGGLGGGDFANGARPCAVQFSQLCSAFTESRFTFLLVLEINLPCVPLT